MTAVAQGLPVRRRGAGLGGSGEQERGVADAVQQECLVHAHSNLRDAVRKRDRAGLDLRFKALREAQGKAAGESPDTTLMAQGA